MAVDPEVLWEFRGPILWAILAALIARSVTVFGITPLVGRLPGAEPIDVGSRVVLFWGGLRGVVALALVLSIPPDFPQRVARAQAKLVAKQGAMDRIVQLGAAGHFSSHMVEELAGQYGTEADGIQQQMAALRAECGPEDLRRLMWSGALAAEHAAYRSAFDRGAILGIVMRELELSVDLRRDHLQRGVVPSGPEPANPIELRLANALFWVVGRLLPRSRFVRRHRLRELAVRYEHDTAIFEASRTVMTEVERLGELSGVAPEIVAECVQAYRRIGEDALGRVDAVAEHFPEYAREVQRRTARRIALDAEDDAIAELASTGGIPTAVAREARHVIATAQRELSHHPVAALEHGPAELLTGVPFFEGISPDDRDRLVERMVPRTVRQGEDIIRQGETGSSLFLIARGVVAVVVSDSGEDERRVATLYATDFFGEMALLTAERRTATVRAATAAQLYELAERDVRDLRERYPGVEEALVAAAEARRDALEHPSRASLALSALDRPAHTEGRRRGRPAHPPRMRPLTAEDRPTGVRRRVRPLSRRGVARPPA